MAVVLLSFVTILIAPLIHPTMAASQTDFLAKICGNLEVQDESKYIIGYLKILPTVQEEMQKKKFATGEDGENTNKICIVAMHRQSLGRSM